MIKKTFSFTTLENFDTCTAADNGLYGIAVNLVPWWEKEKSDPIYTELSILNLFYFKVFY